MALDVGRKGHGIVGADRFTRLKGFKSAAQVRRCQSGIIKRRRLRGIQRAGLAGRGRCGPIDWRRAGRLADRA